MACAIHHLEECQAVATEDRRHWSPLQEATAAPYLLAGGRIKGKI